MKKFLTSLLLFCMIFTFAPVSFANEPTFVINGVTVSPSSGISTNNCSAYASQVLKKIWNYKGDTTTFDGKYNMLKGKTAENREITEKHVKEFIQNAPLGSRIRITHYSSTTIDIHDDNRNGHTLILVAKNDDANSFTTLEAGGKDGAVAQTYTYKSFVDKWTNYNNKHVVGYNYFFYIADLSSFGTSTTKYVVTFDPNGGTISQKSKTVTAGKEIGTLPTPTRDGYTFLYWSTEQTGGGMAVSKDNFVVNRDETLYACWQKNAPVNTVYRNNIEDWWFEDFQSAGEATVEIISDSEAKVQFALLPYVDMNFNNRYSVEFYSNEHDEYDEPVWEFYSMAYIGGEEETYSNAKYRNWDIRWGYKEGPIITMENVTIDYNSRIVTWTVKITDTNDFSFSTLKDAQMYASLNEEKG